jgi:ABC-type uncharacterized transport system permease subunit
MYLQSDSTSQVTTSISGSNIQFSFNAIQSSTAYYIMLYTDRGRAYSNQFKIQVILAAALDMSFKVYDRNLNLIESIKHEERAILQLVFDGSRDIILSSGAGGITLWKFYKNKISDSNHIMEKLLTFESCNYWVTKMIYEPNFERIYVMNDRTVKVYNITRQTLQAEIVNAHYAPVTAACWFARNQFYITGCRLEYFCKLSVV